MIEVTEATLLTTFIEVVVCFAIVGGFVSLFIKGMQSKIAVFGGVLLISILIGQQYTSKDNAHTVKMNAAYFAPGEKHDVLVSPNVPAPVTHSNSQVIVQVIAAGLNPSNFKINFAKIPFVRHFAKHHIVGYDVVGIVKSVGEDASCQDFNAGDKVYGMAMGSMAELAVAMCSTIAHAPKTLTDIQIAGLPVVALTTLEAFHRGGLTKEKTVLVIGASGGCGIFGITLGKLLGQSVTGICSSRNKNFVASLGADDVVDYTQQEEIKGLIAKGKQFDMIYDTVTSFAPEDPNYEPTMRPLLKDGGKYIAINGSPMDWVRGVLDKFVAAPLLGKSGVLQRQDYDLFLLTPTTKMLRELANYFDEGLLSAAPVDSTFNLDQESVYQAFDRIKSRRSVGKIVITVGEK